MDLKSVEIRLEPEEAAKIQAVAEQVGKADFGWEGTRWIHMAEPWPSR